jgi:hypothetical protein
LIEIKEYHDECCVRENGSQDGAACSLDVERVCGVGEGGGGWDEESSRRAVVAQEQRSLDEEEMFLSEEMCEQLNGGKRKGGFDFAGGI